ncbi:hypothetical protein U8V72_22170 [Priestia filamentosa]|uniref:hypothetical protein n=1 Tax=Priestia filamentosa TaxID=1402861 RepID=UPI00397AFF38
MNLFQSMSKTLYLRLVIISCVVANLFVYLFTHSYYAHLLLCSLLIVSSIIIYHLTSKHEKGIDLIMNQLTTAAYIFIGTMYIASPYISKQGFKFFAILALVLFLPGIVHIYYSAKTEKHNKE